MVGDIRESERRIGGPSNGVRVLLVGQTEVTRTALAALDDVEVLEAADSSTAESLLGQAQMVLLNPAVGGGLDLCARASRLWHPPMVVATIQPDDLGAGNQALRAGAALYLVEPIDAEMLEQQVSRARAAWQRRQHLELAFALLDTTGEVLIALGPNDEVVFFNEAASRVLGVPSDQALGRPVRDLLPEGSVEGEFRVTQPEGTVRLLAGRWSDAEALGGFETISRLFVGRDVTRDRSIEYEMLRSGALAELGLLASKVAHDINNPATYLLANLSALQADFAEGNFDPEQARELVDECMAGVERIVRIVRRLRDLARSRRTSQPTVFDLSEIVRDAAHVVGPWVQQHAELFVDIACRPMVLGVPGQLGHAVVNLLVHAAQALCEQRDPSPRIDLSVRQQAGQAIVEVRDNGPGIDPALRSTLFDLSMGADHPDVGANMGLAVCRAITREHRGTVELVPHEGRGAWFRLSLPVATE